MHEGHRRRMREWFIEQGLDGFNDHQVLELLLTYAIPRRETNELAHELIERFGSLSCVLDANPYELLKVDGIGEQTAVFLSLIGAVSRRNMRNEGLDSRPRLSTPLSAGQYVSKLLWRQKYETMYVLCLDKRKYLTHTDRLNEGTVAESVVYPRQVVEIALRHGAQSIILAHNHPSGDLNPSAEDIDTTEHIRRALSPIGINLFDHIVVGSGGFFSFTQRQEFHTGEPDKINLISADLYDG